MPTTDYTEFLHNVKQEYITNSYELDGIFIFDIEFQQHHIFAQSVEKPQSILRITAYVL